jgi:AmmeMemoRadiSam system protein B/AmmeMemoRadiSam system protein A
MKRFVLLFWAVLLASAAPARAADREPAVAGGFYPSDPATLRAAVREYLAEASEPRVDHVVAIVSPHAGYVFCGGIMGEAFRQVQGGDYDVVVILGTNHTRAGLTKAAVWDEGVWRTPLGAVKVDAKVAKALLADGSTCIVDPLAHVKEHSIEVLLPFVETVLPGVPIVPVVVGHSKTSAYEKLGADIAAAVAGRRALIVASSDLSHYPAASDAKVVDHATLAAMATLDVASFRRAVDEPEQSGVPGLVTYACGEAPVTAAIAAANALGATRGTVVAYANSGDAPEGDQGRAVGYGAVVFSRDAKPGKGVASSGARGDAEPDVRPDDRAPSDTPRPSLGPAEREALLAHARRTLERYFASGQSEPTDGCASLPSAKRGAFVTLEEGGQLRGCIGHIAPDLPLCECIGTMALEAALHDYRFQPLEKQELARTRIEISVLTPALPVSGPEAIVIGRDGVILSKDGRSAVFLPQVATEQHWDLETMLTQLSRKAGLPGDAWRSGAKFLVFQAEVFGEADSPR